ncbi:hypothetical protein DIPPA_11078 [Diplonema papillatum]|nr:hypothetical protein DIPPA_11078 [Diplonema papillatum]
MAQMDALDEAGSGEGSRHASRTFSGPRHTAAREAKREQRLLDECSGRRAGGGSGGGECALLSEAGARGAALSAFKSRLEAQLEATESAPPAPASRAGPPPVAPNPRLWAEFARLAQYDFTEPELLRLHPSTVSKLASFYNLDGDLRELLAFRKSADRRASEVGSCARRT